MKQNLAQHFAAWAVKYPRDLALEGRYMMYSHV